MHCFYGMSQLNIHTHFPTISINVKYVEFSKTMYIILEVSQVTSHRIRYSSTPALGRENKTWINIRASEIKQRPARVAGT